MRLIAIVLLLTPWIAPTTARGNQQAAGAQIVHNRRAPVIAHRVVPPFRGVHVYEGRPRR
jgi:hypothetical protein